MDLVTKSKQLHDMGYKWIIFPERYVIYYNDNLIADERRPFNPVMSSKKIQKQLEKNLKAVHKVCVNHNKQQVIQ